MEKIIDTLLMVVYLTLAAADGRYTLKQAVDWSQKVAFEKTAQGLGRLELSTRKMTGGKLDY